MIIRQGYPLDGGMPYKEGFPVGNTDGRLYQIILADGLREYVEVQIDRLDRCLKWHGPSGDRFEPIVAAWREVA